MLHRFRRAMVRPDRERLRGTVEVDETYLAHHRPRGAADCAQAERTTPTKVLVALAVEVLEPKGFGRIRLRRIAADSAGVRGAVRAGLGRAGHATSEPTAQRLTDH